MSIPTELEILAAVHNCEHEGDCYRDSYQPAKAGLQALIHRQRLEAQKEVLEEIHINEEIHDRLAAIEAELKEAA